MLLRSSLNAISLAVCTAIVIFTASVAAQEIAENLIPEAPVPIMQPVHGLMKAERATQPSLHNHRLSLTNLSIAVLIAGEALDSWSTRANLTHRRWICGYSPAFGNAVTYISNDGRHYDSHTIQNDLCGPGPSGQLANYAYDVTRTGAFTEQGWVATFHLAGNRNFAGVFAWNVADDLGQLLVARYVGKRRGLLGKLGPAINLSRGIVHLECGVLNIQFARSHRDPNAWQFHVPNERSLYPTPRWWGRQ